MQAPGLILDNDALLCLFSYLLSILLGLLSVTFAARMSEEKETITPAQVRVYLFRIPIILCR